MTSLHKNQRRRRECFRMVPNFLLRSGYRSFEGRRTDPTIDLIASPSEIEML